MEYTLIRKKNKRAYLRVKDGAVIVTAPLNMPKRQIDAFVEDNREFIERNLKKEEKAIYLEDGASFQVMKETYQLKVVPTLKKSGVLENTLYIKNTDKALKEILKKWFYPIAQQRFEYISSRLGIQGYTLKVGFYKSKWGSCTPQKKIITLNIYLIFTDIEILDSIIYHEFAHTIHFDHSPSFYRQVLAWYPAYYTHHNRLKKMNIPRIRSN